LSVSISESDRNRLLKLQRALLLAASDMRPYTKSSLLTLPPEYIPQGTVDAGYHAVLDNLRDQTYAHTDKHGGRSATMRTSGEDGDIVSLEYREEWLAFPTAAIPALLEFFERQRTLFLTAAAGIHVDLENDV
jgi:hypothetical protein